MSVQTYVQPPNYDGRYGPFLSNQYFQKISVLGQTALAEKYGDNAHQLIGSKGGNSVQCKYAGKNCDMIEQSQAAIDDAAMSNGFDASTPRSSSSSSSYYLGGRTSPRTSGRKSSGRRMSSGRMSSGSSSSGSSFGYGASRKSSSKMWKNDNMDNNMDNNNNNMDNNTSQWQWDNDNWDSNDYNLYGASSKSKKSYGRY